MLGKILCPQPHHVQVLPIRRSYLFLLFLLLIGGLYNSVQAQEEAPYYRLQYQKLKWRVYRSKQFNIYFPANAADSLYRFIASEMPEATDAVKKAMLKEVPSGLNLIIYPSESKSYESNVGMYETSKFPFPSFINRGKRVVLAFNGSYADLRSELHEALARVVWESQVRNAEKEPADKGKHQQDGDVPYWFSEGAVRFFAHDWRIADEDAFRRSFEQRSFVSWQQVTAYEPRLAGQAFCYYVSQVYYPKAVAQTVFQLKKKKSLKRAIRLIAKRELDSICSQCFVWYSKRFDLKEQNVNIDTAAIKIPLPKGLVQQVLVNPTKDLVAYTVLHNGVRTTYIYNVKENVTHKPSCYKLPPWLDDHSKDNYPLLQWHKDGRQLYVAMPVKGKVRIKRYSSSGSWQETTTLEGVDGITSFTPMSDRVFLLSAYREGQSDVITYDDNKGKAFAHTDDEYDDSDPIQTGNSDELLWIGNRPEVYRERRIHLIGVGYKKDTLLQGVYRKRNGIIEPILADTICYSTYSKPVLLADKRLLLNTNVKGTEQFIILNTDNNQVETLVYYTPIQYLQNSNQVLTYKQNGDSLSVTATPFPDWANAHRKIADTIPWMTDYLKMKWAAVKKDSLLKRGRDTTHYIMDDIFKVKTDTIKKKGRRGKTAVVKREETDPYILQLHSTYFSAQVNNDYFINRYQPYANYQGEFKFPELGGMTKGGFADLLENHHFNVAYRLPAATEGSDFNVRYENTEQKFDWGLSYFRKVETLKPDPKRNWVDENGNQYPSNAKVKTHYYELFVRRPLTYYSAVMLQLALRQDRTVFFATDKYTLDFPPLQAAWSINTLSYRLNRLKPTLPGLCSGIKADAFIDAFRGFDKNEGTVLGITGSLRWDKPLYKYITLSAQLHAGYSGGDEKILYNLGGVNNNVTPQTDTSVHFGQSAPYAFQTLITPFRGHLQNSLYGNEYALFNLDVYFPIFKTLIPIETPWPFINNLQPGILSDIATAKETWRFNATGRTQLSYGFSLKSTLAGYPLRIDYAWPGTFSRKPVWYFSLSM